MESFLARKRTLKAKVTRAEKAVTALTDKDNSAIIVHHTRVNELTQECSQLLQDIGGIATDEQFAKEEEDFAELDQRLVNLSIQILNLQQASHAEYSSSSSPQVQVGSEVKLPKLQLPTFTGQLSEWLSFHDLFVASVHSNEKLTGAQKLQYLKTSLKGEPSQLLQAMQITDSNYQEAWEILIARYQNKREIVNATLKRLITQPVIHQESASSLRKLIDTTVECTRSLKVLEQPVDQWDALLVYHTTEKLDSESRRQWELSLESSEQPTFKQLFDFLDHRARALAVSSTNRGKGPISEHVKQRDKKHTSSHHTATHRFEEACDLCSATHPLHKCPEFLKCSVAERISLVKDKHLCFNCLRKSHVSSQCTSGKCHTCNKRHHTLLHIQQGGPSSCPNSNHEQRDSYFVSNVAVPQVLLCTAVIKVQDSRNVWHPCRALLDCASESSFILESCVQKLGLKKCKSSVVISGITGVGVSASQAVVNLKFQPVGDHSETFNTRAVVVPRVTNDLPKQPIANTTQWSHLIDLKLADPSFNIVGPIDILLGADVFPSLLCGGKREGRPGTPVALETKLGWVLSGCVGLSSHNTTVVSFHVSCDLDASIRKFWELEELPSQTFRTTEERLCEQHFAITHQRDEDGRYVVRLPFKDNTGSLGHSRDIAVKRLRQCERRLSKSPELQEQYRDFMNEYIKLGHMKIIPADQRDVLPEKSCYLPHHAVQKPSSSTTKVRVVFDASAKTATGVSLNEKLLVGPKLQDDIFPLLVRFRSHQVPLCADVAKMYRAVLVHKDDINYQRIVWRQSPEVPIEDYFLLTVTYGTASASFLATRCLQQLIRDEGEQFPLAATVAARDFFVDDLLSGASSVPEAIELQRQLIQLLRRGGFELRKWSSSKPEVLQAVPPHMREPCVPLQFDVNSTTIKTLGVQWSPLTDEFGFNVTLPTHPPVLTKRVLLSELARLFDPLGFLSPVTIKAKLLLQSLWKLMVNWDECLPVEICEEWKKYCSELPLLKEIRVKRCLIPQNAIKCQLIGFCDASERAFAANIYCRTECSDGSVAVRLVAAKTKVAPIKQQSIPRLELCSAVLLARLITTVSKSILPEVEEVIAFTDSTTVLAWLASTPSRWKTFIANRVSEIQESLPNVQWCHVSGTSNPSDCASRGINPSELINHKLWWSGPESLQHAVLPSTSCPDLDPEAVTCEEKKSRFVAMCATTTNDNIIQHYSSFSKLQRIVAWVRRFVYNCKNPSCRASGPLSQRELEGAVNCVVKVVQGESFETEIQCLQQGKPLPAKSRILCLNPFIDELGIVRVGGRLLNAEISYDHKYPVLLPKHHKVTQLLIVKEHLNTLHGGPQLVLSTMRQKFWILGARSVIRHIIRKCIICHRLKGESAKQIMGVLPAARVKPSRPFMHSGVDYAGPIFLKNSFGRSRIKGKGYIVLFVCFATKAIHLELVCDATASSFLAALKRFVSRRGLPSDIYSDCGKNFIGANKALRDILRNGTHTTTNTVTTHYLNEQGIKWHFNPPSSPHFGGIWESGIRSVKHHLKRVVGNATLTYEEMYTTLVQIEACLNSRPLTPMSSDPSDFSALTPAHFLVGDSLLAVPSKDFTQCKIANIKRWELTQRLVQHFWKRWNQEYLSNLQQRHKWWTKRDNVKVNDIVLIKDDNAPPQFWKLGRVKEIHPGPDSLVRAVTVRTAKGELKRPIVKVCPLPFEAED